MEVASCLPQSTLHIRFIPCGGVGKGGGVGAGAFLAAVVVLPVAQQVWNEKKRGAAARKLVCFRLHDCQPNDDGLYIVTPACCHSGNYIGGWYMIRKTRICDKGCCLELCTPLLMLYTVLGALCLFIFWVLKNLKHLTYWVIKMKYLDLKEYTKALLAW